METNKKKFLDIIGLSTFKDWLDKYHINDKSVHLPSCGTEGQLLKYGAGKPEWADNENIEISSISESTSDGGENIITFSDGKTMTVKNGSKGSSGVTPTIKAASGANIASVGVPSVIASTSGTITTFTFNNLKGEKGDAGTNATTTAAASTTANGLMSSTDKTNLNTVMSTLALATCSTARNVTAKVATLANFVLKPGATIVVKFTSTTTTNPSSGNLTLNVNNTGAKAIAFTRNGAIGTLNYSSAGAFCNNIAHIFTYNGAYWVCSSYNADNNTWTAFKGCTSSANGTAGYLPAPTKGNQDKFLKGDGTWGEPTVDATGITYDDEPTTGLYTNMTWIGD